MNNLGKTVRLYMADGKPSGLMIAEIINWTGQVYQIPRSQLGKLRDRSELEKTGVYVLAGVSETVQNKEKVYIGESDNVLKRLIKHEKEGEKDFWNRAIVIVSKDENLTKSHARYLEGRLLEISKSANRAEIENAAFPTEKFLPESEKADMEFFLAQMILIFPIMGLLFAKSLSKLQKPIPKTTTFTFDSVGIHAIAQEIDGEFVVFKGSTARKKGTSSWMSYKGLRDQLVQEGKLIDSDNKDFYVFNENVGFSSPSGAASVVNAGNKNGRKIWKVKGTKKTYMQWQDEKLKDN